MYTKKQLENQLFTSFVDEVKGQAERMWRKVTPRSCGKELQSCSSQQVAEIKGVLDGMATPRAIHLDGTVLLKGRVYHDRYKNGLRAKTALLVGDLSNAVATAEVMEELYPVKVVFLPHVQQHFNPYTGLPYLFVKIKVLYRPEAV